ncbi:hypothetical protein PTKIN_Ptkin09bG0128000 [Pterospermum kingtungense]
MHLLINQVCGGNGVLVSDENGDLLGAMAKEMVNVANSFVAEAFAVVHALEFVLELGLSNIILEGDALSILKGLRGTGEDLSEIGPVLETAKQKMNIFASCNLSHVRRESLAGKRSFSAKERISVD